MLEDTSHSAGHRAGTCGVHLALLQIIPVGEDVSVGHSIQHPWDEKMAGSYPSVSGLLVAMATHPSRGCSIHITAPSVQGGFQLFHHTRKQVWALPWSLE